uniref:YqaJ viral recombinase domain-containing protein n=1 Tax=viral metagenome TaxID=1070528 RepID=A0A6C0JL16_9ZZZZ
MEPNLNLNLVYEYLKLNLCLIINAHPEWVVLINYEDLIYNLIKENCLNIDKDLDELKLKSLITSTLTEMNLERCGPSYNYSDSNVSEQHIQILKSLPQPAQKTSEWYKFRHEHITASNAWKAFGTQSSKNQLIYEKCKPIEVKESKNNGALSENPLTWGHKFEPLTRMIYEDINQTQIEDFGCIEHPTYTFLAASPDGIVTGPNNFGRMIEIKNVVSREINGVPKTDYYIQTLLQMEVCNLNECDFVETKFVEYPSYLDFIQNDNKRKGIIAVFVVNAEYRYVYMPFTIKTEADTNNWMDSVMDYEGEWIKNIYWYLDTYSCILIKRKSDWFNYAIPILQDIWNTICIERQGDYSLRAPKKRNNKIHININDNIN